MKNIFPNYSKLEGLKKTLKNVGITFGLPAVLYILNAYKNIVPDKYLAMTAPIVAGVCYFIKNYLENK